MAKADTCYRDNAGNRHDTPEEATLADLADALGRIGNDGGITPALARLLLDKRDAIEAAYRDLDAMIAACRQVLAA